MIVKKELRTRIRARIRKIMATVFESPFLSNRLRQIEERYDEPNTFGRCDCTSYSYLSLSVVLFTVGTTITVFAFGDVADLFSYLGHMWLIGPIFISSGFIVAVKCMLYLRRKSVIQMIYHQRQLFRELAASPSVGTSGMGTPGPPSYEVITQAQGSNELPPPSYAEAVSLLRQAGINDTKLDCGTVSCSTINVNENMRSKP